jgi:uptake hydrogenase large subunit
VTGLTLTLRLADAGPGGARIDAVDVRDQRADVAAVLPGRSAAEALELITRLYSVCGRAQRLAARLALAAARGDPDAASQAERFDVQREALQEHAWRVLLDWPVALGLQADRERFRCLYAGLARAADPRAAVTELGALLAPLCPRHEWAESLASADAGIAALFSRLERREAARTTGEACSAGFDAQREAGALARNATHPWVAALLAADRPVTARVAARLAAIAALVDTWRRADAVDAGTDPAGTDLCESMHRGVGHGRAEVATARGPLVHELSLEGEQVQSWRIHVPTDRNFASEGAFVRRLRDRAVNDPADAKVCGEDWARALDPCVSWQLEVRHA